MHPYRAYVALVTHSLTGDVASKTGQGYFVAGPGFRGTSPDFWRSRCWVWSGRLRKGFVVVMGISSAASN